MAIRTQESLEKLFEASRLSSLKRKQKEQLKYKKAQEAIKKALADKLSTKDKKLAQNGWKQPQIEFSRTITIYNTRYVERFVGEDDLYVTREQLKEAEARGEGKIKWDKFDELVNKTRKDLKKRK